MSDSKQTPKTKGPSIHDAGQRVSAYTYGNILALGALVLIKPEHIDSGYAIIVLLATGFTTYLAHLIAEEQENRVQLGGQVTFQELKQGMRNALPVVSSTFAPAIFLILGSQGIIRPDLAWELALATLVARLFFIGFVIAHYRKEPITFRTVFKGLVIAAAGLTVAVLKALLTH